MSMSDISNGKAVMHIVQDTLESQLDISNTFHIRYVIGRYRSDAPSVARPHLRVHPCIRISGELKESIRNITTDFQVCPARYA